jgi:OHCU decarboxylase
MLSASSWCRWGLSETLAMFNGLQTDEAELRLLACCGSRVWAANVAARRPYADIPALMKAADEVWIQLSSSDWLEAFAAHPRLGQSGGHSPDSSQKEQSRIMSAADATLAALAEENRRYEARFGHVFLISAAGRTAENVLAALRHRLDNDSATELDLASEEQRKITTLRLERMLNE